MQHGLPMRSLQMSYVVTQHCKSAVMAHTEKLLCEEIKLPNVSLLMQWQALQASHVMSAIWEWEVLLL